MILTVVTGLEISDQPRNWVGHAMTEKQTRNYTENMNKHIYHITRTINSISLNVIMCDTKTKISKKAAMSPFCKSDWLKFHLDTTRDLIVVAVIKK